MNKTVLYNFKQKSLRRDRKYFSNHLAHFLVLIVTQLVNATRVKAEQLSFLRWGFNTILQIQVQTLFRDYVDNLSLIKKKINKKTFVIWPSHSNLCLFVHVIPDSKTVFSKCYQAKDLIPSCRQQPPLRSLVFLATVLINSFVSPFLFLCFRNWFSKSQQSFLLMWYLVFILEPSWVEQRKRFLLFAWHVPWLHGSSAELIIAPKHNTK